VGNRRKSVEIDLQSVEISTKSVEIESQTIQIQKKVHLLVLVQNNYPVELYIEV